MPQFGRPISDVTVNGWSTDSWAQIDETVASDADKTVSPTAPTTTNVLECALSTGLEDPASSTGHVMRYRYQKSAAAGAQIDLTVQLMQGATVIRTDAYTNIANGFVTQTVTLSSSQSDAITNYGDLRYQFIPKQV